MHASWDPQVFFKLVLRANTFAYALPEVFSNKTRGKTLKAGEQQRENIIVLKVILSKHTSK
jgi:hypothetical protein